jgi:hypothetical protein
MLYRRLLSVIYIFALFFILIPSLEVNANSGPPSNLRITIINADFEYYFEVLKYQDTPLTQEQINEALEKPYFNKDEENIWDWDYFYPIAYDMPELLASFQDQDGYVSQTLYSGISMFDYLSTPEGQSPNQFILWLNTPKLFKLMLIGENDQIILSNVIEMTQYDYRITWDLEGVSFNNEIQYNQGDIQGIIRHPLLVFSTYVDFFIRLIVTLGIELGILFLFGFRRKSSYMIALGINVISQSVLTIGTLFTFYLSRFNMFAPIIFFIVGEFFIFTGEMIIFGFTLKEKPVYIRVIYAFVANLFSMIIGLIVTLLILGYIGR